MWQYFNLPTCLFAVLSFNWTASHRRINTLFIRQLDNFQVTERSLVDYKPHQRPHLMKAGHPCRPRIDMQHIERFVILYL